jgi:hypothetical protein
MSRSYCGLAFDSACSVGSRGDPEQNYAAKKKDHSPVGYHGFVSSIIEIIAAMVHPPNVLRQIISNN